MYVNTSTQELIQNLEHSPAGGPYPSDTNAERISGPGIGDIAPGDRLTFDINYTAPQWQVAILDTDTGEDRDRFAVNLNGQSQHWALLVWESGSTMMTPMAARNQYPIFIYRNVAVKTQHEINPSLDYYAASQCTTPSLSNNRTQLNFDYCITTAFKPPKPYGLLDEQSYTFDRQSGILTCDPGIYPEYVCRSYRQDLDTAESAALCVNPPEGFVINRSGLIHPEPYYWAGERCGMGVPEPFRIASFEMQEPPEFLANSGLVFNPATGGISLLTSRDQVTSVEIHVRTILKNNVKSPWQSVWITAN
jgi:hypothetical protein